MCKTNKNYHVYETWNGTSPIDAQKKKKCIITEVGTIEEIVIIVRGLNPWQYLRPLGQLILLTTEETWSFVF